jgi:hypothetical protein
MPQAWSTGDVAAVHGLMAPSCDTINPIFGERKSSREEWEEMVKDVFQVRAGGKEREGKPLPCRAPCSREVQFRKSSQRTRATQDCCTV